MGGSPPDENPSFCAANGARDRPAAPRSAVGSSPNEARAPRGDVELGDMGRCPLRLRTALDARLVLGYEPRRQRLVAVPLHDRQRGKSLDRDHAHGSALRYRVRISGMKRVATAMMISFASLFARDARALELGGV